MAGDNDILSALGVHSKSLYSLKFARGVMGHTTMALGSGCAAAVGVALALRNSPGYAIVGVALIAALVGVYMLGSWWFASKQPLVSILGGAELLRWHEIDMAARDMPKLPADTNVTPVKLLNGEPGR